jgi:hypothetical protein
MFHQTDTTRVGSRQSSNNDASIPTYVNEHDVPGLAVLGDPPEGILNVLLGGRVGPSVVAQNQHLALVEALGLDEVVLDVPVRAKE